MGNNQPRKGPMTVKVWQNRQTVIYAENILKNKCLRDVEKVLEKDVNVGINVLSREYVGKIQSDNCINFGSLHELKDEWEKTYVTISEDGKTFSVGYDYGDF